MNKYADDDLDYLVIADPKKAWDEFVLEAQRRRPKGPGGGQFAPGGGKDKEVFTTTPTGSKLTDPDVPSYQSRGKDHGQFTTAHDPLAAKAEAIRVRVLEMAGKKAEPMPTGTAPLPKPAPDRRPDPEPDRSEPVPRGAGAIPMKSGRTVETDDKVLQEAARRLREDPQGPVTPDTVELTWAIGASHPNKAGSIDRDGNAHAGVSWGVRRGQLEIERFAGRDEDAADEVLIAALDAAGGKGVFAHAGSASTRHFERLGFQKVGPGQYGLSPKAAAALRDRLREKHVAGKTAPAKKPEPEPKPPEKKPEPTPAVKKTEDLEAKMKAVKKELGEIYRKNQKLDKDSKEWKANRDRQLELRKQRTELEEAGIVGESEAGTRLANGGLTGAQAQLRERVLREAVVAENPVGGGLRYNYGMGYAKNDRAYADDVREFISRAAEKGSVPEDVKLVVGGSRSKASPDPNDPTAYISRGVGGRVVAHEYGHLIETASSEHMNAAVAFLERRIAGDVATHGEGGLRMSKLRGRKHNSDEVGFPDDFEDAYTGKLYRRPRGKSETDTHRTPGSDRHVYSATEITSVGLERLYTDPVRFAEEDPDFFRFTVAQLQRPKKQRDVYIP